MKHFLLLRSLLLVHFLAFCQTPAFPSAEGLPAQSFVTIRNNLAVSLENKSPEAHCSVYLNPTYTVLNVKMSNKATNVTFTLKDLSGKTIKQCLLAANELEYQVNLIDIPAGIYLYEVRTSAWRSSGKVEINK